MFNDFAGIVSAAIVFVGFNLTFLPQFVLGTRGMPRRYASYAVEFVDLHRLSTIGALMLGTGLLVAGLTLLHSLFFGKKAPSNPWGGATLEWQCSSPPPHDNFSSAPAVGDPYDFSDVEYDSKTGNYVKQSKK
jgi:cytochrome c oxidase subunit 1